MKPTIHNYNECYPHPPLNAMNVRYEGLRCDWCGNYQHCKFEIEDGKTIDYELGFAKKLLAGIAMEVVCCVCWMNKCRANDNRG